MSALASAGTVMGVAWSGSFSSSGSGDFCSLGFLGQEHLYLLSYHLGEGTLEILVHTPVVVDLFHDQVEIGVTEHLVEIHLLCLSHLLSWLL